MLSSNTGGKEKIYPGLRNKNNRLEEENLSNSVNQTMYYKKKTAFKGQPSFLYDYTNY